MLMEFQITFMDKHGDNCYRITPVNQNGFKKIFIQHNNYQGFSCDPELIYNILHEYFKENL